MLACWLSSSGYFTTPALTTCCSHGPHRRPTARRWVGDNQKQKREKERWTVRKGGVINTNEQEQQTKATTFQIPHRVDTNPGTSPMSHSSKVAQGMLNILRQPWPSALELFLVVSHGGMASQPMSKRFTCWCFLKGGQRHSYLGSCFHVTTLVD